MPLVDAVTRGIGIAARTANVGFDEFQNQKRLQQEQEANAKRIEQADLAIEEAQQRKENERKQNSANNAARQMMMHGNSQALQDHLNNYSPEGFKYDIQRKPDGGYTVNETSPNGTVTGTDYDEDEMGTFLYMSTVEQPQAVLADDVKRKQQAKALQAQQQREDQIREDKQRHDIEKIKVDKTLSAKLEKYKSLLKQSEKQREGKVPDYVSKLMTLSKGLADELNFKNNDPDIQAWALNEAEQNYLEQPEGQKSVLRAWEKTVAELRHRQGTDENFLVSIKEAQRLHRREGGETPTARFASSRPDFEIGPRNRGTTQSDATAPELGAQREAPASPAPTARPKGRDVVEKDGRIFVKLGQQLGGRAPKLIELQQGRDGQWYAKDPRTGKLHPYVEE